MLLILKKELGTVRQMSRDVGRKQSPRQREEGGEVVVPETRTWRHLCEADPEGLRQPSLGVRMSSCWERETVKRFY